MIENNVLLRFRELALTYNFFRFGCEKAVLRVCKFTKYLISLGREEKEAREGK
jgi:hypothetical protein